MDIALQNSLASGYWSTTVMDLYESSLLDEETVSIYFEDQSKYFSDIEIGYMRWGILAIDQSIDLDFEFINDFRVSDIDILLGDRTYQSYLGIATIQNSWISLEVLAESRDSYTSNLNTFIHEFMHALGVGEPGYDVRWSQDNTAMSYNKGKDISWRIMPSAADFSALTSLWDPEDDSQAHSNRHQGVHIIGADSSNDQLTGSKTGDLVMGLGGDDIINGGGGDDDLFGGYGRDTFIISEGFDRIFDFTLGADRISGWTPSGVITQDRHGVLVRDGNKEILAVGINIDQFNAYLSYTFV